MALSKALSGLKPLRMRGGAPYNGAVNEYTVSNGYDANIFMGDVVHLSGGYVRVVSVSTDFAIGVFAGCKYVDPTTKKVVHSPYFPANTSAATGVTALVVDDPNVTFQVQADGVVSIGDLGAANYEVTMGAGSTTTGNSGFGLKVASRGTTTKLLRPIAVVPIPGNAQGDATPVVEVIIVQHNHTRVSAA